MTKEFKLIAIAIDGTRVFQNSDKWELRVDKLGRVEQVLKFEGVGMFGDICYREVKKHPFGNLNFGRYKKDKSNE